MKDNNKNRLEGQEAGGTPYNDLYGEAPPEMGSLLQASGISKGRISLV